MHVPYRSVAPGAVFMLVVCLVVVVCTNLKEAQPPPQEKSAHSVSDDRAQDELGSSFEADEISHREPDTEAGEDSRKLERASNFSSPIDELDEPLDAQVERALSVGLIEADEVDQFRAEREMLIDTLEWEREEEQLEDLTE